MEIHHLTSVVQNPTLCGFTNRGLSMEQIQDLRVTFNNGKPFPKAFEEYLFLAGEFNNLVFDGPDTLEELQYEMAEAMEDYHQKMDRPWFAFNEVDSNYGFIFLDEPDDDPKCYILEPRNAKAGGQNLVRQPGYTFTKMVNERIRRLKDGTF